MSKYNYEDIDEIAYDFKMFHVNLMIANELAEANRLKRIEIYNAYKFTPTESERGELEDKA